MKTIFGIILSPWLVVGFFAGIIWLAILAGWSQADRVADWLGEE